MSNLSVFPAAKYEELQPWTVPCLSILQEKTKTAALAFQHEVQGYFKLGCHSTIAVYLVSTFLRDLLEQYAKLEIHLTHDISLRITEQVINLSLDIGLVVNPVKHPDLIIHKLCDDHTRLN